MIITEIICKPGDGLKVLNFIDIVIDYNYRINGFKIIKRTDGSIMVGFPRKKSEYFCNHCEGLNDIEAKYCNWCGKILDSQLVFKKRFLDIFHAINQQARKVIEDAILSKIKSNQVGLVGK